MIHKVVARRYAEALFEVASEQQNLDQVLEDLRLVVEFLRVSPELKQLLEHQKLSFGKKKEIIRELWGNKVSDVVLIFLELLVDKRRERYLEAIYEVYQELLRSTRNIVLAEVKTAFPLEEEDKKELIDVLEKLTRKKVELEVSVDPELIGGIVVKIGDRIFDGSIAKRLELLKAHLAERPLEKYEVG
ncbi:MAG: ATP synthase subunit delta [Thermoanaerobacterales bacterium 50_218]|nr:MAG: ATP synthase subunit delta [Thermoanaerobacterales bacterium 50_218]HAA89098.1 F0F1 ATP synthase subunit delta [Peptococcaceae bacterium]